MKQIYIFLWCDQQQAHAAAVLFVQPHSFLSRFAESRVVHSAELRGSDSENPGVDAALAAWRWMQSRPCPAEDCEEKENIGLNLRQRLGSVRREHERLRSQFSRSVVDHVSAAVASWRSGGQEKLADVQSLVCAARRSAQELLGRQELELRGALAMDRIKAGLNDDRAASSEGATACWRTALSRPPLLEDSFDQALQLQRRVNELLSAAAQKTGGN